MAEIKNNFLQSKMNKDLDDRLIPNGQYRDALNIEVGKSQQDDIGALQNSLGNYNLPIPNEESDMVCIGFISDNQNNRIYRFLTNYTDPDPANITLPQIDSGWKMRITVFDFNTQTYTILVDGLFLNFATNKEFLILGINLIEDLLFWTDNRNQPRKINVALANPNNSPTPTYYIEETQISVAKYAPVEPISMIRRAKATVVSVISETEIELDTTIGIVPGMTVVSINLDPCDYTVVTEVGIDTITLYSPTLAIFENDVLTFSISTMTDQSNNTDWPGDPDFLEDKFVRFSYRFRYDDGEYSLMAPFTQAAYIPRQKGYFINGNETAAYRSTIVRWMENNINNIELLIPLPATGLNINPIYKIKELDILYKESDAVAVKVIESIPFQKILQESPNTNIYVQPYQSQKPYKTLTEDQTVRVYDRVPVRSLAQETSGNRIIYGNFYDTYTPPQSIDYNVAIQPKSAYFTNFIEYPNHTLKQNRNYQVGFILADKFGRQSPVILSTVDLETIPDGSISFGGSTIYSPYYNTMQLPDVKCWFGNALLVLVNSPISSTRSIPNGTPGLYAEQTGGYSVVYSHVNGNTYEFVVDNTVSNNPPKVNDYLRGEYTDYVKVLTIEQFGDDYVLTTDGQANNLYELNTNNDPDTKFAYRLNPIGWYSYKVVVKQQEHDYYNVYLPGMLDGYPKNQTSGSQVIYTAGTPSLENGINSSDFPVGEEGKTSHVVLINDNINKVPRDLAEVGPDQKQYRSSVELFGRVENYATQYPLTALIPANYGLEAHYIRYTISTNLTTFLSIQVGDGLQFTGTLISGTPEWYANTVVVSNEVDFIYDPTGDTAILTFSPANNLDLSYLDFTIISAGNRQYYPTRKADLVSTIATANDFEFLENSVNNVLGTAALNLYQLQTNPLIGRISTVNPIGVASEFMVPFLSVYETRPDISLLDLFWETASTGLISDLNYDVLTGTDLPIGFSDRGFLFYENQNPGGNILSPTGSADSPWITDDFFPINATGVNLLGTSMTLVSVLNNSTPAIDMTARFSLEDGATLGSYRIKIVDNFVFNNNAQTQESYTFLMNVTYLGTTLPLSFAGRLRNNQPLFNLDPMDPASYNRTISPSATEIVTITANNGSYSTSSSDLTWDIIAGDDNGYFSINPYTGVLSLINPSIPIGAYVLSVQITDAVSFAFNPPKKLDGGPFVYYGSLTNLAEVIITVGNEHVNPFLYDYSTTVFVYQKGTAITGCDLPIPAGYGAVYVGAANVSLNANGQNVNLPIPPDSNNGRYQRAVNVENENGSPLPIGLTKGELLWTVTAKTQITGSVACTDTEQDAVVDMILYYRQSSIAPNNIWSPVLDSNNVGSTIAEWNSYTGTYPKGVMVDIDNTTDPTVTGAARSTSFVTSTPGEYCVAVRIIDSSTGCCISGGHGAYAMVEVTDANFATYSSNPTAYKYNLGLSLAGSGYPSGIPYDGAAATQGFGYEANGLVNGATSSSTDFVLVGLGDAQLVPGLLVSGSSIPLGTKIVSISGPNIELDTVVSLADNQIVMFKEIPASLGEVWADTNEGIHVKQFYIDNTLGVPWEPPVTNKFYIFQNANRNYSTGTEITTMPEPTNKPFFCAQFNNIGTVIPQTAPAYNVQTAWNTVNSLLNWGRNLSQTITY